MTASIAADIGIAANATWPALQVMNFYDLSTPVRMTVAALLVGLLGSGILWRYESVVDRSIEASISRPLSALAYGVGAHAVLAFAGMYLGYLIGYAGFPAANSGRLGLQIGLLISGSLGFLVVGAAIVGSLGERHLWSGVVVGALLAGVSVAIGSLWGAFVWVMLVSMGIGGVVRNWTHDSFAPEI